MASKSLNLQLLGETLTRHYRLACELYNTYPVGRFTQQFSQGNLDLSLSEVDLEHLEALCHTIQNKITPLSIQVYISAVKEVGVNVIHRILQGISVSLSLSQTLTTLDLYNIRIKGKNLNTLCQGLVKSQNLKTLSLNKCELGDVGVQNVCHSIKNIPSITHLSVIDCHVADKGALAVANLIQHQRMNRDCAMWQDTLRLRQPHLDGMRGLRRITLNKNPKLNDNGAAVIGNALTEDLWIKALDLQHCGIGAEGGLVLRKILNANQTLEVLDLRQNPFIPSQLVNEVIEVLQKRQDEYNIQYMWLEPSESEHIKQQATSETGKSGKYSATRRINMMKKGGQHTPYIPAKKGPKPPGQLGVPWRVEHRLFERREGLAPGSMLDAFYKEQQSCNLASHSSHEPNAEDVVGSQKIRKQLSLYKRKYQKERKRRKHIEQKVARLQAHLKENHILDEETVSHIEVCFLKFQKFLTHLQNTGFHWQEASPTVKSHDESEKPVITEASNKSQTIHQASASSVSVRAKNSHPPLNIPIPVIFTNKTSAENDPSSQKNSVEIDNPLQPGEVKKSPPPVSFVLDSDSPEKIQELIFITKNNIMEELQKDIQNGRKMLSLQSKDAVLEENMIDTGHEKKTVYMNEIFSEVQEEFSREKGDTEENMPLTVLSERGLEQESDYILYKDHLSNKKDYEKVNTSSDLNKVKPLINEDKWGMTRYETDDIDHETNEEDVNKRHPSVRSSEENTGDISNHVRIDKITRNGLTEIELKNQQDDTELNTPLMERNPLVNVDEKRPDNDEDSTSFNHKVRANEQVSLPNTNKSVHVNILQTPDEIHGGDGKTVKENQNPHITEFSHSTDIAETDDDKLRMQKASLHLSYRSTSVSSVSITEHLSHSHSSWSKGSKKKSNKHCYSASDKAPVLEKTRSKDNETVKYDKVNLGIHSPPLVQNEYRLQEYGSDFEISDVEGVSISASSLTTTSIPDDLLTPGEEEF